MIGIKKGIKMEISIIADDIVKVKAGAIIVNYFEGTPRLDGDVAALDKALILYLRLHDLYLPR